VLHVLLLHVLPLLLLLLLLLHSSLCRVVEDQIKAGLKPYADLKGTGRGRQQLVKLQVCE
jgi:hypothetical protein